MRLICKQIRQDVATANGRVYSREALDRIAALSNHLSLDGRCMLAVEPSESTKIALKNVVGKVNIVSVNDGHLEVEVELLDTEQGAPLRALAPGVVGRMFTVAPLLYGDTSNGMNVDPYSLRFSGWTLIR